MPDVDVGSVIDGRFRVVRRLGGGKPSDVYEAVVVEEPPYASKGDHVAVKVFKPWVLAETNQEERIERELAVGQEIQSDHLVDIHERRLGDPSFLVMELVDGQELGEWIQENPHPNSQTVLNLAHDLAKALTDLHDEGLIHRDVKPSNVMVTDDGLVLLDFGVAYDEHDADLTSGDDFLGTIRHAAPEYLFGKGFDATVDTFSFGSVLYHLALGEPRIDPGLVWSEKVVRQQEWSSNFGRRVTHVLLQRHGFRAGIFLEDLLQRCLRQHPDVGVRRGPNRERPTMGEVETVLRERPHKRDVPPLKHHTNEVAVGEDVFDLEEFEGLYEERLDREVEENAALPKEVVAGVPLGAILVEAALLGGRWPVEHATLEGLVSPDVTEYGAREQEVITELVNMDLLEGVEQEARDRMWTSYYLSPLAWRMVLDGLCDEVIASVNPDEARKKKWESISEPEP